MKLTRLAFLLAFVAPLTLAIRHKERCTKSRAVQRKDWAKSSRHERLHYINGIKCLQALPSRFEEGLVPATTSYFGDFAAVHINLTQSIHTSGIFLSWHRHYIYLLEKALHQECGYPAYLGVPYWNWAEHPHLETSPIFDGGPLSLGSNGLFNLSDSSPIVLGPGTVLPHGTGGGCVTNGPFANTTVTFGPFAFALVFSGLPTNWTNPNPRCLNRDLKSYIIPEFNSQELIDATLATSNIIDFQTMITSQIPGDANLTPHGGGHFAVGGVMSDFFASPQDPAFYLHHGMIDRIWAMWQDGDPDDDDDGRRYQFNGTSTIFNPIGVTPEVDKDTVLDFGLLTNMVVTLEDVADPMSSLYCYTYV